MTSKDLFHFFTACSLSLALSGCSDSNNDGNWPQTSVDSPQEGEELSLENTLATPGRWRFTITTDSGFSFGGTRVAGGPTTTSSSYLIEERDEDSVINTYCSSREAVVVQREETFSEPSVDECPKGDGRTTTEFDDNMVLMQTYCGDELQESAEVVRVSDEPTFSSGNFSFNSSQFPDASLDDGVCGTILRAEHEIVAPEHEAQGTEIVIHEFKATMPYGESLLEATVNVQSLRGPGEYAIGRLEASDGYPAGGVAVSFTSTEFGSTSFGPVELRAESGSIEILELDDFFAEVAFDVVIEESGGQVSGSFVVDLR